jgi:excisionase family DNA binding protein
MSDVYIPEPIYNLDRAAERCGVSRDTVAEWVRERGMRAFPLGNSVERRPRDYLILERWLIEYLETNSVAGVRKPIEIVDPLVEMKKRRYRGSNDSPLGPCPV